MHSSFWDLCKLEKPRLLVVQVNTRPLSGLVTGNLVQMLKSQRNMMWLLLHQRNRRRESRHELQRLRNSVEGLFRLNGEWRGGRRQH